MTRRATMLAVACACALGVLAVASVAAAGSAAERTSAPVAGDKAPPEIADPAVRYAQALVRGDLAASWGLLSKKSRAEMPAVQWEEAFRQKPVSRPPSGNALLKALATADPPASVVAVLLRGDEALMQVSGTVQIKQELVLVKEGNAWLVDLAASDEINSREAAEIFLEAVSAESGPPGGPRPTRRPSTSLPMLQALLAPEAKDYRTLRAEVQRERAQVTLACDLPVNVVLRAMRSGPGWMIDLSRPLVNTSPTSPEPLKEAAESVRRSACEDQLRQLARAIQMYASSSGDMLPDPDRWLEQIRPYLSEEVTAHCPSDPTPGVSYAMNRNLAGKKRSTIGNQAMTPLLYESMLHAANPADTGESWPLTGFHPGGTLVLYMDGSIRASEQKPSFSVTEAPPTPTPALKPATPRWQPIPPPRPSR